ncbi:MAG: hypothetical protein C0417_04550, partial [Chlorobiaceae bacterium]|nr:hypothetical protein [Chlorobiaceae bacterium]
RLFAEREQSPRRVPQTVLSEARSAERMSAEQQEERHSKKTFAEEINEFNRKYGWESFPMNA